MKDTKELDVQGIIQDNSDTVEVDGEQFSSLNIAGIERDILKELECLIQSDEFSAEVAKEHAKTLQG